MLFMETEALALRERWDTPFDDAETRLRLSTVLQDAIFVWVSFNPGQPLVRDSNSSKRPVTSSALLVSADLHWPS